MLNEPKDGRAYVEYTEHVSKNNPGGLKQRKCGTKNVRAYANTEDRSRCFVCLYKSYVSLQPVNAPKMLFYLHAERRPTPGRWYQA